MKIIAENGLVIKTESEIMLDEAQNEMIAEAQKTASMILEQMQLLKRSFADTKEEGVRYLSELTKNEL